MKNKLYLAGILLICMAVGVSVSFLNQRQQEMERIHSLEERMSQLHAERLDTAKDIKETAEKKQIFQNELDEYKRRTQLLNADISKIKQDEEVLLASLSNKNNNISEIESRLSIVEQQESELQTQLQKSRAECQDVMQKVESARKEKAVLEEEIKSHISSSKGVELKKIVVKLTSPQEGKILDVNKGHNFVIINMGQRDDIKSGDVFGIYRKDQLIAKAVAENIYEDMSSIIVLDEWRDVPILTGDTVRLLK